MLLQEGDVFTITRSFQSYLESDKFTCADDTDLDGELFVMSYDESGNTVLVPVEIIQTL